jgi:hypothetical protein
MSFDHDTAFIIPAKAGSQRSDVRLPLDPRLRDIDAEIGENY